MTALTFTALTTKATAPIVATNTTFTIGVAITYRLPTTDALPSIIAILQHLILHTTGVRRGTESASVSAGKAIAGVIRIRIFNTAAPTTTSILSFQHKAKGTINH